MSIDILQIIEILSKKDIDLIDNIKDVEINEINIPEENCRMRTIEIFNAGSDYNLQIFEEENKLVSQIDNIVRALYIVVDPNTVIPDHYDEEDPNYRIATGVYSASNDIEKLGLCVEDKKVNLSKGVSVGINASVDLHGGWNYTDQYWIILVLIVKNELHN
jgi:hypothetical protein